MVVHRAAALGAPAERITFVPSYVARDPRFPDHTNTRSMRFYGRGGLLTELARHGAWLSLAKLEAMVRERDVTDDHKALAADLRAAVADALRIADELDRLDTDERDETGRASGGQAAVDHQGVARHVARAGAQEEDRFRVVLGRADARQRRARLALFVAVVREAAFPRRNRPCPARSRSPAPRVRARAPIPWSG